MHRDEHGDDRRAKIVINPSDLRALLDLPEAMSIENVHASSDPYQFVIIVSAPWLTPVPEGSYSPMIEGSWQTEHYTCPHTGKMFMRWGWDPDQPDVPEHPMWSVS